MRRVSTLRLYLLRAGYLLIGVGLISQQLWPTLLSGLADMKLAAGTVSAMLWALALLSFLGVRYPLRMLPLLFFEMTWKAIWLLAIALPKWQSGTLTGGFAESAFACALAGIFLFLVPWGYVFKTYVTAPGDPWWGGTGETRRTG